MEATLKEIPLCSSPDSITLGRLTACHTPFSSVRVPNISSCFVPSNTCSPTVVIALGMSSLIELRILPFYPPGIRRGVMDWVVLDTNARLEIDADSRKA